MDNVKPKHYWFKAKKYGFGWQPSSWQGWLTMIIYLAILIHSLVSFDKYSHSLPNFLFNIFPIVVISTLMLMWIMYSTGEPQHWKAELESRF